MELLDADYFRAELVGPDLRAQVRVSSYLSHGLATLFADVGHHWPGWSGTKAWRSLEGELGIAADCDRTGHVTFAVRLQEGAPPIWSVTVELVVEAGQLERLAQAAAAFVASLA